MRNSPCGRPGHPAHHPPAGRLVAQHPARPCRRSRIAYLNSCTRMADPATPKAQPNSSFWIAKPTPGVTRRQLPPPAWGACAPGPVSRGLCATSPKRLRACGGVRVPPAPPPGACGPPPRTAGPPRFPTSPAIVPWPGPWTGPGHLPRRAAARAAGTSSSASHGPHRFTEASIVRRQAELARSRPPGPSAGADPPQPRFLGTPAGRRTRS